MIFPRFVIPKRFERLTHALEGRCSIQLSYGSISDYYYIKVGFEPTIFNFISVDALDQLSYSP